MDIINIDIKILNDKYEIFLNKIIYKTKNVTTYLGKNIFENTKILIDIYSTDIQILAKKIINTVIDINNDKIIKIIDVIIEKNITYIIKPYYDNKLIDININKNDILYYFYQIVLGLEYLFNKNIEIENLYLEQIYLINNDIIISPYFENNIYPKNIIYGSPIFNRLDINIKIKNDIENKILKNISVIFVNLIYHFFYIKIDEINENYDSNESNIISDFFDIYLYLYNNTKINPISNIAKYIEKYSLKYI